MKMQNTEYQIQNWGKENPVEEKSMSFAVRIVNLFRYLNQTHKEFVLSKQLLRSGTSIGANIAEAQRSQSRADFAAKMGIALKEASETKYWLTLLQKTEYISTQQYSSLITDLQELLCLLTAICKTANYIK